ncbi:MAG: protein-methionine-sulfoxide reductase heme-binding subunit MsrQ [Pseudomonadota bacterium]
MKPFVFVLCLLPLALVLAQVFGFAGGLGANPVETLQDHFGEWGLRFLLVALAVTPLRRLTGLAALARYRRMLGLFAFTYVAAHFLVYVGLEQRFSLAPLAEDVLERPYITVGFASFLVLLALAATSTLKARRRLGRRWTTLHRGAYVAAVLAVWHYWWQVKKDLSEPLIYAAVLALLFAVRLWYRQRDSARRRSAATA